MANISIETRLTNVENMLRALISRSDNDKKNQGYNNDAFREVDSRQGADIEVNTSDVATTREAIEELYEMISEE